MQKRPRERPLCSLTEDPEYCLPSCQATFGEEKTRRFQRVSRRERRDSNPPFTHRGIEIRL
jgi:hypothetical protein